MGKDVTTLKIKFEADSKAIVEATGETKRLDEAIDEVSKSTSNMSSSFSKMSDSLMVMDAFTNLFGKLNDTVTALTQTYAAQEIAEARLGQVMRNTMGATDEEIQSIKDLCAAQQELGVIGDEVQIAGAQELGTYLEKTDSLKTLIPVMNDMVAQQYGLNASQESAVGIATMLGKVMEGQVGALSRYGYSFDEVEEQILKFGTEEEKVIVLSKVVGDSVGGMNEALAQTDSGKMQQLSNTFGDMKEKLGQALASMQPYLSSVAELATVATSAKGILTSLTSAINLQSVATKAMSVAQVALNAIMSANPIAIVVLAIAALTTAFVTAYNKCETFRNIVNGIWTLIKARLTPVFETLGKVVKKIWNYMADLFGFDTSSTEETTDAIEDQADAYDDLYASMQKTMEAQGKDKGKTAQASPSGSLKALSADIQALQAKVELEVDPQKRAELYKELDKLKNLKLNIEAKMKLDAAGYAGEMDKMQASTVGIRGALDSLSKGDSLSDMTKRHKKSLAQAVKDNEAYAKSQEELAKSQPTVADGLNATSNVIGSVAQAIGSLAGESKAAAVAQRALAIAGEAVALAGAISSATKGDPYTVAPRIAAAVAAVVAGFASFASLPKFANGGIISGPTIGLMGEYSGASNNPEVVAPLNKLKSMLGDVGGGMDGQVQFEIKGRKLVGVLARENSIRSRS